MRQFFKIVAGVAVTIFLGAVGSGLWERFMGPGLDWLTRATVGAISNGHTWYRDSIYVSASKGFHEAQALALYSLVLGLLPLLYAWLLLRHPVISATPRPPSKTRDFMRSSSGYWLTFALTIVVFVTVTFNGLRLRHINETITYALASFEIVRPYVGEEQYARLRSRFYAMRTGAEFDEINRDLIAAAKKFAVKLPEYEPL